MEKRESLFCRMIVLVGPGDGEWTSPLCEAAATHTSFCCAKTRLSFDVPKRKKSQW